MKEIALNYMSYFALIAFVSFTGVSLLSAYVLLIMRRTAKEVRDTHRELFGLMRKIEGMTSDKREALQFAIKEISGVLEQKLPEMISNRTGEYIFETEKVILQRLAELEPNFKNDMVAQAKMNELIQMMESLERTVTGITEQAVKEVLEAEQDFMAA